MSLDSSLKSASSLTRHRNVLTRAERLTRLSEQEKWNDSKSVYGLPKVANRKLALAKAEKDETAETAAPAAGAAGAKPAAGAKGAAAPAAAGKAPAGGKAAAAPAAKAAAPAAKGKK
jgi:small basic protein (TIGR04137 family)